MENKELIFPWSKDKSKFPKNKQKIIIDQLQGLGFDLEAERLDSLQEKQLRRLMRLLLKKKGENSWVLLMSNNYDFLQALANDAPCVFALTSARTVLRTDSAKMLAAFVGAMKITSSFEPSDPEEYMIKCMRSGLLVWENPDQYTAGCNKYEGKFSRILAYRSKWKLPTVFTVHIGDGAGLRSIQSRISKNLGQSNEALITQKAAVVEVKLPMKAKSVHRWS